MTLDSNILVAYLNGESAAKIIDLWKKLGRDLCISSLTVTEVLSKPGLTAEEEKSILGFLDNFISVPFDDKLAHLAAMVRRVKFPDAAIAATALERGGPLVSRDRAFRKVKELTVLEI